MEVLSIQKTRTTPTIKFDPIRGILEISGRSIPENASQFYEPILQWIDEYKIQSGSKTVFKIYLEYFNTGSSKYLYQILKRLEEFHNKETESIVQVEWFYDKGVDELAEAGEDYKDILRLPFQILQHNQ